MTYVEFTLTKPLAGLVPSIEYNDLQLHSTFNLNFLSLAQVIIGAKLTAGFVDSAGVRSPRVCKGLGAFLG